MAFGFKKGPADPMVHGIERTVKACCASAVIGAKFEQFSRNDT
jgi:hypothetical protein